jgi:hypothetical protein
MLELLAHPYQYQEVHSVALEYHLLRLYWLVLVLLFSMVSQLVLQM